MDNSRKTQMMYSILKNRTKACQELKHRGFKIGKTKFYKDCHAGLCRVEPDGSILESALNDYINNPLARLKKLDQPWLERRKQTQQTQRGFLVIPIDSPCLSKVLSVLGRTGKETEDGRR